MKNIYLMFFKEEPISEISHLDKKDKNIDEKYQEFKDAINKGTYNDDYNLTNKGIEKLKSQEIYKLVPILLELLLPKNILVSSNETSLEVLEIFKILYEIYLARELVLSEKNALFEAVRIMLWKIHGRTFKNICQIRYARISRINERKKNPQFSNEIRAMYMVGYNEIPNKKLPNYPKIPTSTLAKDVDYDLVVYDTYDFLDKLIGFKLSDIYYAIFNEYYLSTHDERALKLANYIKFGTSEKDEIWMLKYGFDFEDIAWLKACINKIDENEIIFNSDIEKLDNDKRKIIEKYIF